MHNSQSGNVLFYILIAVALLAALSYAVSSSGRGGTENLSEQRAALYATDILEYSNTLRSAVDQLRLRGCKFLEINFDNPALTLHSNSNAPADGSCNVFGPNGAGVNFQTPPTDIGTNPQWSFTYENNVDGFGDNCTGIECKEIIGVINNVSLPVCSIINEKIGLPVPPPEEGSDVFVHFGNKQYDQLTVTSLDFGTTSTYAIKSGCVNLTKLNSNAVGDVYYFYVVLWEQF